MTQLTGAQVYQLAVNAGLSPAAATVATAIAYAESGWNPDAQGDTTLETGTWGPSVGLWQIRSLKAQSGTGQPRDAARLTDPTFNAQSMATISGFGRNFTPWITYTSGAYHAYMSAATTASGQPAAALPTGTDAAAVQPAGLLSGAASDLTTPLLTMALKGVGVLAGAGLVVLGLARLSSSAPPGGGGGGGFKQAASHAADLGALAAA